MAPKKHAATYDDILKLPEHLVGEILEGELVVSPRPASPHAYAASMIGGDLTGPFNRGRNDGGPGGWWIVDEPELHFRKDVLVPDLAGWRRERMPRMANVPAFELAPDWVCEVLSPSTRRHDVGAKSRIYAREKAPWMWRVDPLEKWLEILKLDGRRWIIFEHHEDDARVRAEPFEAIEIDLSRWWLPDDPPAKKR